MPLISVYHAFKFGHGAVRAISTGPLLCPSLLTNSGMPLLVTLSVSSPPSDSELEHNSIAAMREPLVPGGHINSTRAEVNKRSAPMLNGTEPTACAA